MIVKRKLQTLFGASFDDLCSLGCTCRVPFPQIPSPAAVRLILPSGHLSHESTEVTCVALGQCQFLFVQSMIATKSVLDDSQRQGSGIVLTLSPLVMGNRKVGIDLAWVVQLLITHSEMPNNFSAASGTLWKSMCSDRTDFTVINHSHFSTI